MPRTKTILLPIQNKTRREHAIRTHAATISKKAIELSIMTNVNFVIWIDSGDTDIPTYICTNNKKTLEKFEKKNKKQQEQQEQEQEQDEDEDEDEEKKYLCICGKYTLYDKFLRRMKNTKKYVELLVQGKSGVYEDEEKDIVKFIKEEKERMEDGDAGNYFLLFLINFKDDIEEHFYEQDENSHDFDGSGGNNTTTSKKKQQITSPKKRKRKNKDETSTIDESNSNDSMESSVYDNMNKNRYTTDDYETPIHYTNQQPALSYQGYYGDRGIDDRYYEDDQYRANQQPSGYSSTSSQQTGNIY